MKRGKLGQIIKKHEAPLRERLIVNKEKANLEKKALLKKEKEKKQKELTHLRGKIEVVKFRSRIEKHEAIEKIKEKKLYKGVQVHMCPKCKVERKFYPIQTRSQLSCAVCRFQLSLLVGTIFEKTTTPMKKWEIAIQMCRDDEWVQAIDIKKACRVTYKTAWRMRKLILGEIYPRHKSKGAGFFEPRPFKGNQYIKAKN